MGCSAVTIDSQIALRFADPGCTHANHDGMTSELPASRANPDSTELMKTPPVRA